MSPQLPRPRAAVGRILEITSYPPPRAGWGVRVSYLRRHLLDRGHECLVMNIGRNRKTPSDEYVTVTGLFDFTKKVIRFARRGFTIHTHINGDGNKGWLLALVAELVARASGRPCVLTFHAGPLQRYFPRERSGVFTPLLWLLLRLPHCIVCNDENVKRGLQTYGVPGEKIRPIPAFSRQYLEFTPTALPEELDSFASRRSPLLVAYFFLRPEFFIDSLIAALARVAQRFPDLGVVMVGDDTNGAEVGRRLAQAGIRDRTFPAGDLDHDRFMTLLSRCHCYVRTPSKDGVCSSVLEALSLGVPVIASENGRRPESVITFRPDDAEELAAALERTWTHYAETRAAVQTPEIRDTVEEETALLLAMGGARVAMPIAAVPRKELS